MDAAGFRPDPMDAAALWAVGGRRRARPGLRHVVLTAHLLVPMTLTAALGTIGFAAPDGTAIAAVWPAAALQLCMSVWFGVYGAIAGTVGPMLGNGLLGASPLQFVPANAIQSSLLGLWFRWRRLDPRLRGRRDWVGLLVVGCVGSNALGATAGVAETWLRGLGQPGAGAGFWAGKWLSWFVGNTAPCLILAPLLMKALSPMLVRSPFFCQGFFGGTVRRSRRFADLPMTAKLMILTLMAGILPLSVLSGWTLWITIHEADRLAAETNLEFIREVRGEIDRRELLLRLWSDQLNRAPDSERHADLLAQWQASSGAFHSLRIEPWAEVQAAFTAEARAAGEMPVIFCEDRSTADGSDLLAVARLAEEDGRPPRALMGRVRWDNGGSLVSRWLAIQAVVVFNRNGEVLYRSTPPALADWRPGTKGADHGADAPGYLIAHGGDQWHVAEADLPRLGWRFMALTPRRPGMAAVLATLPRPLPVLINVVIFGSLIIGGFFAQRISGRVLAIAEHVRSAGGRPDRLNVPVRGGDELGYLAGTLNRMSRAISRYVRSLQETTAENQRLAAEMELAREVQLQTLPAAPPAVAGYDLAAVCRPAREVGGDFYDFFTRPDGQVVFMVGDAVGKGLRAAMYTTETHGLAHAAALERADPDQILAAINAAMIAARGPSSDFVTMFCAVLDPATHRLRYASAGHNPPLRISNGHSRPLQLGGVPLAVLADPQYPLHELQLDPGDMLLMYTDGVTEAHNPARQLFDVPRLESVARAHVAASAVEVQDAVLAAVAGFTDGAAQSDDITLVTVRRCVTAPSTPNA